MTYDQFVQLFLNLEWARVSGIVDAVEALRVGVGGERVPDGWIDIVEPDPVERSAWRQREFRRTP